MKILINHDGFELNRSKIALLEIKNGEKINKDASFVLIDHPRSKVVMEGSLGVQQNITGWKNRWFYELDFSTFNKKGSYSIRVYIDTGYVESRLFAIDKGLLTDSCISDILFYFKSQRASGYCDKADRQTPFYGARKGRVDVHGGWYDASGDYSKYLSHLSYANYLNPQQAPLALWSLLTLHDTVSQNSYYSGTLLEQRIAEEAIYGADFLVRMQDPQGYFYMTVFDQWSKNIEKRMICTFHGKEGIRMENYQAGFRQGGGMSIAALARVSCLSIQGDYSSVQYLEAAKRGWDHLCHHNLEYLDNQKENIIDVYCALIAAIELYKASKKSIYLDQAGQRARELQSLYNAEQGYWTVEKSSKRPFYHASDAGLPLLALEEYFHLERDGEYKKDIAEFIRCCTLDYIKVTQDVENPFFLARAWVQPVDGKVKTSFFMPHKNESGYWWQGENARLASMSCAIRRAKEFFTGEYAIYITKIDAYADAQLHWIMGRNPFDTCMLQGHGHNNPRYENHFPNAPGGICNGITAGFNDENDIDFLPVCAENQGDHRWRWSEQWIPHASWYLLALATDLTAWKD